MQHEDQAASDVLSQKSSNHQDKKVSCSKASQKWKT